MDAILENAKGLRYLKRFWPTLMKFVMVMHISIQETIGPKTLKL